MKDKRKLKLLNLSSVGSSVLEALLFRFMRQILHLLPSNSSLLLLKSLIMSAVKHIHNKAEFDAAIQTGLVVVDFSATWWYV